MALRLIARLHPCTSRQGLFGYLVHPVGCGSELYGYCIYLFRVAWPMF